MLIRAQPKVEIDWCWDLGRLPTSGAAFGAEFEVS